MIYWYQKAAQQHFPKAIDRLGMCYEIGRGVKRDKEQAYRLYCQAANEKDEGGLYHLALCYAGGKAVKTDYGKAKTICHEALSRKPDQHLRRKLENLLEEVERCEEEERKKI